MSAHVTQTELLLAEEKIIPHNTYWILACKLKT